MELADQLLTAEQSPGNVSQATSLSSSSGTDDFHSCQELEYLESSLDESDGNDAHTPTMSRSTTAGPSMNSSVHAHTTLLQEQMLFFGAGLGSSVCYIATLSSLVHFKLLYGADSFLYLNSAVFFPLLPISLAQARWDQYLDIRYTSRKTFLVRGVVGFVLGLLGTMLMIKGDGNPNSGMWALVLHAGLQGTGGAILYGTLNQLSSFVGGNDSAKLKAAVSAGVQASALVVLVVSFVTGFGIHEAEKFCFFLWAIVFIELVCFVIFIRLLVALPRVGAAMIQRDSSFHQDEDVLDDSALVGTPLLVASRRNSSLTIQLSYLELIRQSFTCCSVLVVTLIPSFLVGSWFTRVQTDWMELASFLFYIRIAFDFFGRLATVAFPPRSTYCLASTSLLRLVPVALFFFNAHGESPFADALSIVLVAVISFLSGYLVTASFQLAPLGLDWEVRQANVTKQASLLTVAFAISAVGGLVSSFLLMAVGV